MAQLTTLIEIAAAYKELDAEDTIFAKKPWTGQSEAVVMRDVDGRVPDEAKSLGLDYFLEISITNEFLDAWVDWSRTQGAEPTLEQKCQRLIQYATYDA